MKKLAARIRVILTAAPTWLVFAALTVQIVTEEISKILPAGWAARVVAIGGAVGAIIGAAIAIIRRVSPVLPAERGILPRSDRPL